MNNGLQQESDLGEVAAHVQHLTDNHQSLAAEVRQLRAELADLKAQMR